MFVRNETVDALRAVAALSVCFFHFTHGQQHFAEVSVLRSAGSFGWLGVEVFFVISGFIVPYAMARANYSISSWPKFMAKRLIRLEPPYLISIAVVIILTLLSSMTPGFRGPSVNWSAAQIAAHLGYLNAFIGLPWLNPAYWSLAIEFQYYVLIGLALPLFSVGSPATRIGLVAVIAALPAVLPDLGAMFIIDYLPIFATGFVTFLLVQDLIGRRVYWAALVALAIYLGATSGLALALASVLPAAMIATVRLPRVAWIAWLGTISYSIYLLHVPVGGRVMNLVSRLPASSIVEIVAVAVAFAISILAAYGLYVLIEKPARDLAALLRYGRKAMASAH